MLEIIGAVLRILQMLLGQWFNHTDEKKEEIKEILKGVPDAKTTSDVLRIFDHINRL